MLLTIYISIFIVEKDRFFHFYLGYRRDYYLAVFAQVFVVLMDKQSDAIRHLCLRKRKRNMRDSRKGARHLTPLSSSVLFCSTLKAKLASGFCKLCTLGLFTTQSVRIKGEGSIVCIVGTNSDFCFLALWWVGHSEKYFQQKQDAGSNVFI